MIELRQITKEYNTEDTKVVALDNVSLKIDDGEYVGVMGRSGSGKTTLLNIISGMETVTSGQLLCDGKDITAMSVRELDAFRKNNISYIFQNYLLINSYTVYEK